MSTTPTLWRAEQQANTADAGPGGDDQRDPQIVGLTDGTFIVLWEDNSDVVDSDNGTDIIGQRYDAEGNKIGSEYQVNFLRTADNEGDFTAAALANGNYVVAYEDTDAAGTSIVFEIRSPSGTLVDNGLVLNDPGADILGDPSVTVAADNSFLVTYQRNIAGNVRTEVVKVDSAGNVGAPLNAIAGSDSGFQTDATTLADGRFVVVSRFGAADDAIAFRIIGANGTPQGVAKFVANTAANGDTDSLPTVTALTGGVNNGGFVVAWQNQDALDIDLQFQVFDAAGNTVGPVRTVNGGATTDNNNEATLIGLSDGGFVIVYDDDEAANVKLQRFDANGNEVGAEVTVTNSNIETTPTVTLSDDGRLLVGWTNSFAANADVEFSILDPRENVINGDSTGETITSRIDGATVKGNSGGDTLLGQGAADVLKGGLGADDLFGRASNDVLKGGADNDLLKGSTGNDRLNGGIDDDKLLGGAGNDVLKGGLGNDILKGGAENDRLSGGAGDDILTGKGGADRFVFDTGVNPATNVDLITDIQINIDEIRLDNAVFDLALGDLGDARFKVGTAATDANDRIVYNDANGNLFYDADGVGGQTKKLFAKVDPGLNLDAGDFFVI